MTISHKIIKKSLPDRPLRGRSAAAGAAPERPRPQSGRSAAAERPRSGRSGNDFFMILCKMVTKPFKIGPFGMPLRRFFFLVFVLKEVVPGAGDQDSTVFLMFFDVIF